MSGERQLHGSVAVITGGTGKLGVHLAREVALMGATIVVPHFQPQEALRAPLDALKNATAMSGTFLEDIQADLTSVAGVKKTFEAAEKWGGCDILINGASLFSRQSLKATSSVDVCAMTALNVDATLRCTQIAVAQMKKKGGGRVVNILDVGGGIIPWKSGAAYCATRAAIAMATQCLALELFDDNISVTGLAIGLTELSPEVSNPENPALRRIPMGRGATIDEVTCTLKFLLSKEVGQSLSGNILALDGGRSVLHGALSR